MPWNPISDGDPAHTLLQFAHGLNQVLNAMCAPDGVLEKYAFAGDMAGRFLASASQGRGGVYHVHMPPPPTPCDVPWPHPTRGHTNIKALVLQCKLELVDPTDSEGGCAALESGLADIVPVSLRAEYDNSQWHHTHTTSIYGHVLPGTSTYLFHHDLGLRHAFHIVWDANSYPPWTATNLPFPENVFVRWPTTVPLIINPLLEEGDKRKPRPASPDTAFFRDVIADSKNKGKGRA
ncbi:hypothetical protein K438DRAFT_1932929 [Mycena galopus ATCC 62051]|nr:hypothetical protein K438DRAFT_1932929 [Mycena galopus ATCC 62051]